MLHFVQPGLLSAVAVDGPLVRCGYLVRHGRQPIRAGSRKRRRTVTLQLTAKAINSFERYLVLSRFLVHAYRECGSPLTWSERVLMAFLVSRHSLVERIAEEGNNAEDRHVHSLAELGKETGLARNSIIAARQSLQDRGMILVDGSFDGTICGPTEIRINPDCLIPEASECQPAVEVLRPKHRNRSSKMSGRAVQICRRGCAIVSATVVQMCRLHLTNLVNETLLRKKVTIHLRFASRSRSRTDRPPFEQTNRGRSRPSLKIARRSGQGGRA